MGYIANTEVIQDELQKRAAGEDPDPEPLVPLQK